jgi:hypothetical protein
MSHTGLSPSSVALPSSIPLYTAFVTPPRTVCPAPDVPYNPAQATPHGLTPIRFRLFPFRSPLLWESHLGFFSTGYLDGSVPRV